MKNQRDRFLHVMIQNAVGGMDPGIRRRFELELSMIRQPEYTDDEERGDERDSKRQKIE